MAVSQGEITLAANVPQKITGTDDTSVRGRTVMFRPLDGDVYVGNSAVTTADGLPVYRGEPCAADVLDDDLYLVAAATTKVRVLRIGAS